MAATDVVQNKTKGLIMEALSDMFPQEEGIVELIPVKRLQWLAIYPSKIGNIVKYLEVGTLGRVVDSIIPITLYHHLELIPDSITRASFRKAESKL